MMVPRTNRNILSRLRLNKSFNDNDHHQDDDDDETERTLVGKKSLVRLV